MSEQTAINDPHLASLLKLALARAATLDEESANVVRRHAEQCAITLQGYVDQLHTLANDPRLQEASE